MDTINIVYIDDNLDKYISRYLNENYKHKEFNIYYEEIQFNSNDRYDKLINCESIRNANIIIIDSRLFENNSVIENKFTGEEFKIILKKVFPFIEVLVITQNDSSDYGTIQKYKFSEEISFESYYSENLKNKLNDLIEDIKSYRNILKLVESNNSVDKLLTEKIKDSLEGTKEFDELKIGDIDKIIKLFKNLENKING